MKVLIYSHVSNWQIHHAETIELALKHIDLGDDVYVLSCDGALTSCPANTFHNKYLCISCKAQTNYTMTKILCGQAKDFRLKLRENSINLPYFSTLEELKHFRLYDIPFGELVTSQLVDDARDCYITVEDLRPRIESLLQNSIALYTEARKIIRESGAEMVYVWNGRRCSDGPVCYAARDEDVTYNTYISGGKKNTYMTIRALKVHGLVESKKLMEELFADSVKQRGIKNIEEDARLFYAINKKGGGDFPGFTYFGSNFSESITLKKDDLKKRVVIFPSSFWEHYAMGDYISNDDPYPNHYYAIKKILNDERVQAGNSLFVRWHPNLKTCGKNERKVIDEIIQETSENAVHFAPESTINSYDLIDSADVVVTFGSTVGIEANFYGKPSIMLGHALYEDTGACYIPKSHEEFIMLINSELMPLPKTGALKYGYYQRNRGQNEFRFLTQNSSGVFYYGRYPIACNNLRNRLEKFVSAVPFSRKVYELFRRTVKNKLGIHTNF